MNTLDLFALPLVKPAFRKPSSRVAVFLTLVITIGFSLFNIGIASAWPSPTTSAKGAACSGGTRTSPITWTVTNEESSNKGSPATIQNVVVAPSLPTTTFSPSVLPNTGSSFATATTTVGPLFEGTVTLTYKMVWSGSSGHDVKSGSASISVKKCVAPATTTRPPTTTRPTTTRPPTTRPPTTGSSTTTRPYIVTTTTEITTFTTTKVSTTNTTTNIRVPAVPAAPVPARPTFTG